MENQPMKNKSQSRIVTMLGIPVIFVIFAVVITSCVRVGEDYIPNSDTASGIDSKENINSPVFSVKDTGSTPVPKDAVSDTLSTSDSKGSSSQSTSQPRHTSRREQVSTFETMSNGWIWYNNEEFNYTFKFPGWLDKQLTEDGNISLSANAAGKSQLTSQESFTIDNVTVTAKFIEQPEDVDSGGWYKQLTSKFDETMTYKGWTYPVDAVADSGGPFVRRALAQINDNGVLEVTMTYYSTPESHDVKFQEKAKEVFAEIIYSTSELYLSD